MNKLVLSGTGFNGFVKYFTKRRGSISKYITATGFPDTSWGGGPSVVLDYSLNAPSYANNFVSFGDKETAFIHFTFKYSPILLTKYTLRTRTVGTDEAHAKSWKVEGSTDNKTYFLIHNVTNSLYLQNNWNNHTYECDNEILAKYIKITLTEATYKGSFRFHLSRVEFFGEMYGFIPYTKLCKKTIIVPFIMLMNSIIYHT